MQMLKVFSGQEIKTGILFRSVTQEKVKKKEKVPLYRCIIGYVAINDNVLLPKIYSIYTYVLDDMRGSYVACSCKCKCK